MSFPPWHTAPAEVAECEELRHVSAGLSARLAAKSSEAEGLAGQLANAQDEATPRALRGWQCGALLEVRVVW